MICCVIQGSLSPWSLGYRDGNAKGEHGNDFRAGMCRVRLGRGTPFKKKRILPFPYFFFVSPIFFRSAHPAKTLWVYPPPRGWGAAAFPRGPSLHLSEEVGVELRHEASGEEDHHLVVGPLCLGLWWWGGEGDTSRLAKVKSGEGNNVPLQGCLI